MTISKTRSQLVTEIQEHEKAFLDSPAFSVDYLRGKLSHFHPVEPPAVKSDSRDTHDPRVSVSIISQWKSHRANAARFLAHDPVAQKEFLARFDADTIEGSREYDRRFAARTAALTEVNRLDSAGPGDDLNPVTKAQIAYSDALDKFSKRSQRNGGFNGGGGDAA